MDEVQINGIKENSSVNNFSFLLFRIPKEVYSIDFDPEFPHSIGIAGYYYVDSDQHALNLYQLATCPAGYYKLSGLPFNTPCSKCPPGEYIRTTKYLLRMLDMETVVIIPIFFSSLGRTLKIHLD